jgi:ribonuclease HII
LLKSNSKSLPQWELERDLYRSGVKFICGVDEAGRGPLAGPVVAAAVIFPDGLFISGVDDSKKLSPKKRHLVCGGILRSSLEVGVGIVGPGYIDQHNILKASLEAMRLAVESLTVNPKLILVDGNRSIPGTDLPQRTVISGDRKCHAIAAASIVAKVTRDLLMMELHRFYPQYDFAKNKGYPTPAHGEGLRRFGPCPIHRKSFKFHHTRLTDWP